MDEAMQAAAENAELTAQEPARMAEPREKSARPVSVAAALPPQGPPRQPPPPLAAPLPATTPLLPAPPLALPQAPIPPQAAPQASLQEATRNGRITLFLTLALTISFGAYLVHARLQPGSQRLGQVRAGVLGMRVDRQGGSLLVSWNRQAPEIQQASEASFRIVSGGRVRTLSLSPHELRTGSLLYTLSAEDIEMELNVSGPVGEFAESVRVVGAGPGEQLAFIPIRPRRAAEPRATEPRAASERTDSGSTSGSEDPRAMDTPQQRKTRRAFVEPPSVKTENKPLAAPPEAPVLQVADSLAPAVPLVLPSLPAQLPPQRNGAPQNDSIDALDYVPPRAIRSAQPSVGAASSGMGRAFAQTDKPHSIQVEVSIDERGAVSSATLGASTGPFAYLFVDSALAAARRWQFEPARRGGRPVASKMTLKFDFVKSPR